jgi:pimeloyl-ACP methyl ester carboxylesterase
MWSGSKARSAPPSGTLDAMADTKHVVLIHGTWLRGDSWADTRAEFEQRGYTVHTPTLRFHDLPFEEGAKKVGPVSLRDYADDLAALVEALDSPPLLIGHSLGGLIAQLAAARTRHAGVVAACTAPAAGIFSMYPSTARIFLPHYLQSRPWDKPLYPTTWKLFRSNISNTHTEEAARELYADLVCDSGRVYCEMAFPWLDRAKAASVDFAAVTTPVLAIGAESDKTVDPRVPRTTATKYRQGTYVEIPRSDHLVFVGESLPLTMSRIDDWMARNNVLSAA